ncbi:hypothetical protein [Mediterranea massiliensis]|uniref:hypothetical protein n=1 Tax=Mediterranea massiliensis TaxID=1841865 RepID=UPI0023F0C65C|nr:hypothetical protein [Mediterranea massiliensis]
MTNNQEISEEEARSYLSFYVADPERLDAYIARLHSAPSLKEVERILVAMVRAEGIPTDILTRQEFYMTVRVFFAHLKAGRSTLHEHFVHIQSAAKARISSADRRALLKSALSGGIEMGIPKPGEKLRYTIELVITISRGHGDHLQLDGNVVEVKQQPMDSGSSTKYCCVMPDLSSYKLRGTATHLSGILRRTSSNKFKTNLIEIEYRSPLMHRKHLSVRQALDLLKREPQ